MVVAGEKCGELCAGRIILVQVGERYAHCIVNRGKLGLELQRGLEFVAAFVEAFAFLVVDSLPLQRESRCDSEPQRVSKSVAAMSSHSWAMLFRLFVLRQCWWRGNKPGAGTRCNGRHPAWQPCGTTRSPRYWPSDFEPVDGVLDRSYWALGSVGMPGLGVSGLGSVKGIDS